MSDELERWVDRMQDRAGHPDHEPVRTIACATLRALGSHLGGVPPALHDVIPRALHAELHAGEGLERVLPATLHPRLAEQTGLRVGVVLELVQSAMAELGELLAAPGREGLREQLPAAWAALVLEPRGRARAGAPVRAAATAEASGHQTLASGRPGGSRPLADAAPPSGQHDSIATSDDPHGGRLASARGPGPREDARTLAKGRPGSPRSA